jgi:membrane-bound lytic murein transglycosylase D
VAENLRKRQVFRNVVGTMRDHPPPFFLVAASLLLVGSSSAAQTEPAADARADSGIDALLADLYPATEAEVLPEDDVTAALSVMLRTGFARTPTVENAVSAAFARERERATMAWPEQLADRRLLARLLPHPTLHLTASQALAWDIPIADHPLVDLYVDYFSGRGRFHFAVWLARADRFIPVMEPILVAQGLPKDLVYVAMVESGFSARAMSWASAGGFWQFIRPTGQLYGLEMSVWVDERRDFVRSTEAAAAYLKALYQEHGDWHLAWASYNAGSGRVRRAMARVGTRDYWKLAETQGALATETRHYVPKILAAAIIAKNREQYGFTVVEKLAPLEFETVIVDDAVDLRVIAKKIGVASETLHDLNPALLQDVTPPGRRWQLRVPKGQGETVTAWLTSLPADKRLTYRHHTVARGDSLWKLADHFGSSIEAIREFNRIRDPRALKPGTSLVIPTLRTGGKPRAVAAIKPATGKARPAASKAREQPRATAMAGKPSHHVVAVGDTLWSIATRYGVSVQALRERNGLHGNTIVTGTALRLF